VPATSIAIRVPGQRRARGVLGTMLACAGLAVGATSAAAAQAQPTVTVCAAHAALYETPGGAQVGVLHNGDHVRVLARGDHRTWWRVVARFGTRGWLRETAVCERDR
jgi:hypothetical protein